MVLGKKHGTSHLPYTLFTVYVVINPLCQLTAPTDYNVDGRYYIGYNSKLSICLLQMS